MAPHKSAVVEVRQINSAFRRAPHKIDQGLGDLGPFSVRNPAGVVLDRLGFRLAGVGGDFETMPRTSH